MISRGPHPLLGLLRVALACLAANSGAAQAQQAQQAQQAAPTLPSFAELEARGARIGSIRVLARDIFDTDTPEENYALFRLANQLHIQTRASVIERALLFKSGEAFSVRALEETERLLRSNRYLNDVQFRVAAVREDTVDIDVVTRDTWSLEPGFSAGRSGGTNSSGIGLKEHNLLGTGVSFSLGRSKNVDRQSTEFGISNDRAFGTFTNLAASYAESSDGRRSALAVVRPFYELDARWAAGASALRDSRIDAIYNASLVTGQYRHREQQGEVFAGLSAGLVQGWVRRWSLGLSVRDDRYAAEPGLAAPAALPADQRLVAPFVRLELIEERYLKLRNRNLVGKPEFFALGFSSTLQLGWAGTGLGSTRETLLYAASASRGFEPAPAQTLLLSGSISGQWVNGAVQRQRIGAQLRWFVPQDARWVFFASASGDTLTRPAVTASLLLGGDNGLRGYPLRYQSGLHRALFVAEERYYTDLYVWRLFRLGAAAFADVGRAWGGAYANPVNPGWLTDLGLGLRILNDRSAFSNVLHIDLAFPLNPTADIRKVQLLVKTKLSF